MPRASLIKNHFEFSKGKLTEFTGLNFPENALTVATNVDINFKGEVSRRKGLDYHPSASISTRESSEILSKTGLQAWVWEDSDIDGENDVLIMKESDFLIIYLISALTGTGYPDYTEYSTIPLLPSTGSSIDQVKRSLLSVTFNKGVMYWSGHNVTPGYFRAGDTAATTRPILIRDTKGIEEEDPLNRPSSLNDIRKYNLLNNGWPADPITCLVYSGGGSYTGFAWDEFKSEQSGFPNLSDRFDGTTDEAYNAGGNRPAISTEVASGRAILNLFDQQRNVVFKSDPISLPAYPDQTPPTNFTSSFDWFNTPHYSRTSGVSTDHILDLGDENNPSLNYCPGVVSSFQGHLVFGTVNEPLAKDTIYISQTIKDPADAFKAYSINDPTADIESSPLDTDGGTITIDGLGNVLAIRSFNTSLLLFSDQGVWELKPTADSPFSINNITVIKLLNTSVLSGQSVVDMGNRIFLLTIDGIYAITKDNTGLALIATNIAETTILSAYLDIKEEARKRSAAAVDRINSKIYWMYNSNPDFNVNDFRQNYNAALVLDTRTGAFYDYYLPQVDNQGPFISAGIVLPNTIPSGQVFEVVADLDDVVAGVDNVVATSTSPSNTDPRNRLQFLIVERSEDVGGDYDTNIDSIGGYQFAWVVSKIGPS